MRLKCSDHTQQHSHKVSLYERKSKNIRRQSWLQNETYEGDYLTRVVHTTLTLAAASHGRFEIWALVYLVIPTFEVLK